MLKKKVLHINHTTFGGTGRVVNTIIESLELLDYDNVFVTVRGDTDKKAIYLNKFSYYFSKILSKIFTKTSTSNNKIEPEVFCSSKFNVIRNGIKDSNVEIIILYWINNTITTDDVRKLAKSTNAKIYIYLMDEAFLTGGCFYFDSCENYIKGCGNCPAILWGKIHKDITYNNARKDRTNFNEINPTILCPSTQSLIDSEKSYILQGFKKEKLLIPLGDDYGIRKNKIEVRANFNIDHKGTLLFFGASSVSNERKGTKYLLEALSIVYEALDEGERDNLKLVIAGNAGEMNLDTIKFESYVLGYLSHNQLVDAYKMSDIFVSSSIIDMGPMMVNESIKSGLPVVCFDIGISKDLVINGQTGFRVETKNVQLMAESIIKILRQTEVEKQNMIQNCLKVGENLLSYRVFNDSIKEIFNA
ncbi:glycosyltransferase [Chryseobacterium chendengshani]|uniref:glycosyltransferase n=1 Tax=Chryseobacterium sp. LJ756 TaxID=2864113 RepID=UPI001C63D7E9|nr:glycosyltransferase [Chryseobacterium sp. LJ756]MBW7676620.1 glycosyltransferase [Chryseobacterium sp. LJ756]